jgi:hypothetical protein
VTDEDGDTPLYAVENADTARWLVEHGADAGVKNKEGLSVSSWLFGIVATWNDLADGRESYTHRRLNIFSRIIRRRRSTSNNKSTPPRRRRHYLPTRSL